MVQGGGSGDPEATVRSVCAARQSSTSRIVTPIIMYRQAVARECHREGICEAGASLLPPGM